MGILTSVTGNGYILSIGNLKEGVVASYNYTSSIHFESDDYGQIDFSIELISDYTVGELKDEIIGDYSDLTIGQEYTENYGSISSFQSSNESYGYITIQDHLGAFGQLQIYGSASNIRYIPEHNGSGALTLLGASRTKFVPTNNGSGSLFAISGSAESVAYKLSSKVLFTVEGQVKESTTSDYNGSGCVFIGRKEALTQFDGKERLVSAYERVRLSQETTGAIIIGSSAYIEAEIGLSGRGLLKILGTAKESSVPTSYFGSTLINANGISQNSTASDYNGSGSLFAISGSVESVLYSPSSKALFTVDGQLKESVSPAYSASGSLFAISGSAESVSYSPSSKVLFTADGQLKESVSPAPHVGFGSILIAGASSDVRFIPEHNGSGSIFILGASPDIRFFPDYPGSGSLFAISGSAESVSYNPSNKVLFTVSSQTKTSFTSFNVGSGFLTIRQKAVKLIGDKYSFFGALISISPAPHVASGSISIVGASPDIRFTPEYTGSGYISAFGGSAVSSVYTPSNKIIFNIEGKAKTSFTPSTHNGSGAIELFGKSKNSFSTASYDGLSSILINVKSKESRSRTSYIGSEILNISGSASEIKYIPNHSGSGTILIQGSSSRIKYTPNHNGSGSIFGLGGSGKTILYSYPISQKAFRIFGSTFESFGRTTYVATMFSNLQGKSENQKVSFVPAKKTRILLI